MGHELQGATLVVDDTMSSTLDMEFELLLSDLLEVDSEVITLDLSIVTYIGSLYIGAIAATMKKAKERNKILRVVAKGVVSEAIKKTNLDQIEGFVLIEV